MQSLHAKRRHVKETTELGSRNGHGHGSQTCLFSLSSSQIVSRSGERPLPTLQGLQHREETSLRFPGLRHFALKLLRRRSG